MWMKRNKGAVCNHAVHKITKSCAIYHYIFKTLCYLSKICPYCIFTGIYFWKAEISLPVISVTSLQCCCLIKKLNWCKTVRRLSELSSADSNTSDFLLNCINRNWMCRIWKGSSLLCLVLLKPLKSTALACEHWGLLKKPTDKLQRHQTRARGHGNMACNRSWKVLFKLNDTSVQKEDWDVLFC